MSDTSDAPEPIAPLEPIEDVAAAVLSHPEHSTGIEDLRLELLDLQRPSDRTIRLLGRIHGLTDRPAWEHSNLAVRLTIPVPDAAAGDRPAVRIYTVRRFVETGAEPEIEIDLVAHGEASPALTWLETARIGDTVGFAGPRPHQVPPTDGVKRSLLFADGSGLPAVHAIVSARVDGPPTEVHLADVDPFAVAELPERSGVIVKVWTDSIEPLVAAARAADIGPGDSVWGAGERDEMRSLRSLARDRGLSADAIRVFGYWKRGITNTQIDIARLRKAKALIDAGQPMQFDDLDLDV